MTTSPPAGAGPPPAGDGVGRAPRGSGAAERARAAAVAAAVAAAGAAAGVALDEHLAIWALAGGRPATDPARREPAPGGAPGGEPNGPAADLVARVLEAATDDRRRRTQGLHVTPGWLADRLVAMALPREAAAPGGRWPTVCDPACGGGAFLVAAAGHLHRMGASRREVVRDLVWGADIDRVGLAAAEAALTLWAGERPPPGRLVVADSLRDRGPLWPAAPPGGFDAVVGNPPFLSQLGRATARTAADQRRLRVRFGPVVRAYTDTAWLFLLVGCDLVRPGGRVVLVEPESVVAARDAAAIREAVERRAVLRDLWVGGARAFAASVEVCAPVLERRPDRVPAGPGPGPGEGREDAWAQRWARTLGVPPVDLATGPVLAERATVHAGFRDEYYGLVAAVREAVPDDGAAGAAGAAPGPAGAGAGGAAGPAGAGAGATVAPLVTSGALDWAACSWGERPIRFARRRWRAPVVDLDRLARAGSPPARRWVERTLVPKVVVATQTRVVEAAVDVGGTWVPSVPALAVVPAAAEDLWRLAAAVLSPAATAWLARRAAGTALGRGSLRVAAPTLGALPLPSDRRAWEAAAAALARFAAERCPAALEEYLAAIDRAYATASPAAWWWSRAAPVVHVAPAGG